MLNWANRFNIFCFLDNHHYAFEEPAFDCLLATGCRRSFSFKDENSFQELYNFHQQNPSFLFGHAGYNAGKKAYPKDENATENFNDGFFFEPEIIIKIVDELVFISSDENKIQEIFTDINEFILPEGRQTNNPALNPVITREQYIEAIKKLQWHIQRGDCYEINFCLQFTANDAIIDPVQTYEKLAALSPAPFAGLYKLNENYCLCASPERFIKKTGSTLISQPIKGTSRRDHLDKEKDEANKQWLLQSEKEKSENVMIVDLVRNDLSIPAQRGSVFVKELFGLYSFPQVHQMISTIQAELAPNKTFADVLDACFPMGSMTGAPKKKVMELIAQNETNRRGLFSGSIGYITPEADMDFNVVIRSIFYNSSTHNISLFAGSGITFYCEAEQEYEECMAKAEAMMRVLSAK